MQRASRETNELMRVVFDHEREVRHIVRDQNPLPLLLTNRHRGTSTVRFTKGVDVQSRQCRNVPRRRLPQDERHSTSP